MHGFASDTLYLIAVTYAYVSTIFCTVVNVVVMLNGLKHLVMA